MNIEYPETEVKAFTNLFRSYYQQPLEIDGPDDLNAVAEQAKAFGCFPTVSYALNATLARGDSRDKDQYLNNIPPSDVHLIIGDIGSVNLLRNAELYKECVILCAGQWTKYPDYLEKAFRLGESTGDHVNIIGRLHQEISYEIASLHWVLINHTTSRENDDAKTKDDKAIWRRTMEATRMWMLFGANFSADIPAANYYRSLYDEEFGPFGSRYIRMRLKDVLENRLPLNSKAVAGEGSFKEHFIYLEVHDMDLPWDVNDTSMDW